MNVCTNNFSTRLQQNVNEGEEVEQPVDFDKPATQRVNPLMEDDYPVSKEQSTDEWWITWLPLAKVMPVVYIRGALILTSVYW